MRTLDPLREWEPAGASARHDSSSHSSPTALSSAASLGAAQPPASGPSATTMVGRYALHAEIAAGGMATIHIGRLVGPVGFARTVAIKRLHPQFAKDPEFVAAFLDEARVASRIRHPNVVPTLDVVATEGELFVVMEYILGESLAQLMRLAHARGERVPVPAAISIMVGVLHGLQAAHEATDERGEPLRIVHRDVSPHNVLVGSDGAAHVIDFGIAKARGRSQVTREGQIKGKLSYMPPEQLLGSGLDHRADVFAASIVLWEALTGRRLFQGVDDGDVLARVLHGQVEPPSAYAPGLSRAVDGVVLRGLARDRAKRYATAREMALALEAAAPLVPPSQIGAWVQTLAGDSLAERARMIAEVERDAPAESTASSGPLGLVPIGHKISDIAERLPAAPAPEGSAVFDREAVVASPGIVALLPESTAPTMPSFELPPGSARGMPPRSGALERTALVRESVAGVASDAWRRGRFGIVAVLTAAVGTVAIVGALRLRERRSSAAEGMTLTTTVRTAQRAHSAEARPPALPPVPAIAVPTSIPAPQLPIVQAASLPAPEPISAEPHILVHRSPQQAPVVSPAPPPPQSPPVVPPPPPALPSPWWATHDSPAAVATDHHSAGAGARPAASVRPAAPQPSAAPDNPSCDPPFWYDSEGNKRYYRHCASL